MARSTLASISCLLLASAAFAAGDAEWQSGVNSLNSVRKDVNANSASLRKAGVNVNQLNQQLSMAERQLMNARMEMLRANMSQFQNSTRANILNQYDIFRGNSAFSSNGSLRLVPISPIVDMGMSNAFSSSGTLLKSSSLYEVKPTFPFQPMRSPEEVLKANSSLAQPQPAASSSSFSGLGPLPPPSSSSVASSAKSGGLGAIDPSVLKASDPAPYSLKVAPPPPLKSEPLPPPEPLTTGPSSVIVINTTARNDYVILPSEGKEIKANVSGFVEADAPFVKGKAAVGTGGVDLEGGAGLETGEKGSLGKFLNAAGVEKGSWDGSGTKHWDWNGESSTVWKTGPSMEVPVSPLVNLSAGAGRSWSSKGQTTDSVELALSKGFKIPFTDKVKGKAGASLSFEWNAEDNPDDYKPKLYGPIGSRGK